MSDTATLSFDSPKAVDLNAIQAAITAEAGPSAAEPTPVDTPAADATPATAATTLTPEVKDPPAATPAPQADELKTYKITVDGQELEVTEADLKAGHMRQRDYTQKTQRIAEQERALKAEQAQWNQERDAVKNELAQIDQFLRDQDAVKSYMEKAFGISALSATAPPVLDPNTPPTAAQVAEIARYNAEQVRLYNDRQLAQVRAESLRTQQAVIGSQRLAQRQAAEAEIDLHIQSVLLKYPVLKKFDGIEEELMGEASRYMPTSKGTLQDAKAKLSEAADRRMATIKAIAEDEKKAAAVEAAKLKKNSTDATGGTPPKPAPGRKLTLNASDRKEFLAAAEADLRAALGVDA